MQKHVKIYMDYFGYDESDFISCEVCGKKASWTHHIDCRGMGGSKQKDTPENLMAICYECEVKYADKKQFMEFLINKHKEHAIKMGRDFRI